MVYKSPSLRPEMTKETTDRKTLTAKRQLSSPTSENQNKKSNTEDSEDDNIMSTDEAILNMDDESSEDTIVPDEDLLLVQPDAVKTLMSIIKNFGKNIDSLTKELKEVKQELVSVKKSNIEVKQELVSVKKSNTEMLKILQEKVTESTHPTEDDRYIVPNWGSKFHQRRSEFKKEYNLVEKAKIIKSFVEGDEIYITRKHRVNMYNSKEEFKLKERLAATSMVMEADLDIYNATRHKEAYLKIDQEVYSLIDASNESPDKKDNLKKRWDSECKKAETKAKDLCRRGINFMSSLPTEYPYEGYEEPQESTESESQKPTYSQVIAKNGDLRKTFTNDNNHAPVKKYSSGKNLPRNSQGGASNYNLRSSNSTNTSNHHQRESNPRNAGRYYDDKNSRDYRNGGPSTDAGFQFQKRKNNSNRNFQKGTGLNSHQ